MIILCRGEEWLLHLLLVIDPTRKNILLEKQACLLDLHSLFLTLRILLHHLDEVLARLSTSFFDDLVKVDHTIREVYDLEIKFWRIQLVKVFDYVRDRPWSMPLAWILVVDQAHPDYVLDREDSLSAICIIIHESQHSDIARHICAEDAHVIVEKLVAEQCMGKHHLSHSDRTTPADVVVHTDLELALLPLLQRGQENLYLLNISLEQRPELSPITEPQQGSEFQLELLREDADLLLYSLSSICIQAVCVLQQEDGQLICPPYLHLICAEELDEL